METMGTNERDGMGESAVGEKDAADGSVWSEGEECDGGGWTVARLSGVNDIDISIVLNQVLYDCQVIVDACVTQGCPSILIEEVNHSSMLH